MENINSQQISPTQPDQRQPSNISSKSKLKFIISIFIVAILLIGIGGYFAWSRNSQVVSQNSLSKFPLDCGADFDCFIKAAKSCSPASIKKIGTFEMGFRNTFHFEIKGQDAEKCIFYGEIENIESRRGKTPTGIISTCSIDRNDLVSELQNLKVGIPIRKLFECLIRGAQGAQRKGADILAEQFAQGDNVKRKSDVMAILNAISQYMADNKGTVPSVITTSEKEINKSQVDLCSILVPTYIAALPVDPKNINNTVITSCTTSYSTGYTIVRDVQNKITVKAPNAEGETIQITR